MSELLKKTIYETLRDWGHDVYLQRFNNADQTYVNEFEKHTVRNWGETALHSAAETTLAGLGVDYDMTYVMLASAEPKEHDRIYEESTNPKGQDLYRIEAVEAKRGRLGEIVFYVVGADRVSPT